MGLAATIKGKGELFFKTVIYAGDDRANVQLDALVTSEDFPALIISPISKIKVKKTSTGARESSFDLEFWALDKHKEATIDFDTFDVEEAFTEPMRLLAAKFVHALDGADFINENSKGIEEEDYQRADGVMDAHLFGVKGSCVVPVIENLSVCD